MKNDLILQEIELMLHFLCSLKLRHNMHILYVDDGLFKPSFKTLTEYRQLLHRYLGMEGDELLRNYMLVAICDTKVEILSVIVETSPLHDTIKSAVYYRFDYGTRGGESKVLLGRYWSELNIFALWHSGRTLVDDWMSWCAYRVFDDDDVETDIKYRAVRSEILMLRKRFGKYMFQRS